MYFPVHKFLFFSLLTIRFATQSATAEQPKGLLFVGQSEFGWQVQLRDPVTKKLKQLTRSLGDKRTPCYSSALDVVLFKTSDGRIWAVSSNGEEKLAINVAGCADFVLFEGQQTVFVTKMVTGNSQRQLIWKGTGQFPITNLERFYASDTGSLRQIRAGHEQQLLLTHIALPTPERVGILSLTTPPVLTYLSAQGEEAAYPSYHSFEQSIVSKRVSSSNYDLFVCKDLKNDPVPLVVSENYSEFASTSDGNVTYFERISLSGEWSVAMVDAKTKIVEPIKVPMQAKEPFIAAMSSTWFAK